MDINPNTTLLELLNQGSEITLPNKVILKGDPKTRYIEIGFIGADEDWVFEGLWDLSEDGLSNAIEDSEKIAENSM